MSQNNSTTVQAHREKTTENYGVYESADGDTIVGMYVSEGASEQVGEFAEVTVSAEADVEATLDKTTQNYGVFSTEGGAVNGMYVSHDVLSELTDDYDSEEGVSSIGLTISPSDEDSFEQAEGVDEEEEAALVGGSSESESESEEDEEEVKIPDEEVGLVEADD